MYLEQKKSKLCVCLVLPSLSAGGMERVMTEFAFFLSHKDNVEVHLILLSRKHQFFKVPETLIVHEPIFTGSSMEKSLKVFKLVSFLRGKFKNIKPYSILSFGSVFNSLVMLACWGLPIKTYLSDRSNPYRNSRLSFKKNIIERHDGILHFFLKRILYRKATGLVVQTEIAKSIEEKLLRHKNVIKLPNPIYKPINIGLIKQRQILNVGRFIKTKQQELLVEIFSKTNYGDWKLIFAGEGPQLEKVKKRVSELRLEQNVIFLGNVINIAKLYSESEIFAFTSISEGFPNALGEAMAAPLAVISFDCVAGPSELIDDGHNGFLVPVGNAKLYEERLNKLMSEGELREKFKKNALKKMDLFDSKDIMEKMYKVVTG